MRLDFSPFFRSTVGFDRLFDMLDQVADTSNGYPPYNIERTDENHYRITVAVAGFAEKDLNVEVHDGVLTVTGKREDGATSSLPATRASPAAPSSAASSSPSMSRSRPPSSRTGCSMSIWSAIVPEEKKPRRIAINAPELKTIEGPRKRPNSSDRLFPPSWVAKGRVRKHPAFSFASEHHGRSESGLCFGR